MIRDILASHALASARQFETDRSQTIGASEIGQCARKIWFTKNEDDGALAGGSRDEDSEDRWGARLRGSIYEEHVWVPAMRARFGERLLWAGAGQRTFVREFLSATPDGLIVRLSEEERAGFGLPPDASCLVLDCKTADPRTKLDRPKPEHVYQVIVQVGLVRELTKHAPTHGVLTYTNASFWDDVVPFLVPFDAAVYAQAKMRARDIMTAPDALSLPPEGIIAGGKECGTCPFTAACGQRRAEFVPTNETRVEMPPEIAALALRAREERDDADAAMDEARSIEQQIRSEMARAGARKMAGTTVDGRPISISWAAMNGRPSTDTKALSAAAEAAGVDVSAFSKAGDPTDRLVITLKG